MQKPETLSTGTKVGPFRVIQPINEGGGMATLYLAEVRERYRRKDMPGRVALKVARAEYEDFLRTEADILSHLSGHSHIVRVYRLPNTERLIYWAVDTVKIDNRHNEKVCFMAMEYVAGGSPRRWLDARGRLGMVPVVGISRQIANGLARAHRDRIVHLDIKPDNVLFRTRRLSWLRSSVPDAVLCDWGIARDLTQRHALVVRAGTEDYMPPELFYNRDWNTITCSADVYMLGVTMYEMLTGRLPFDSPGTKLDPTASPPPIQNFNRRVSPEMAQVVMKSLERDPSMRYPTGTEMREALDRVPAGIDGGMIVRQLLAGVGAAALLIGLTFGGPQVWQAIENAFSNPTSTITATAPAVTPTTPSPPLTRTPQTTATPVNTYTPVPTPIPTTRTPTPTP
jgi:serine/threonine protein kinase